MDGTANGARALTCLGRFFEAANARHHAQVTEHAIRVERRIRREH
jgi:hypothetical protein